MTLKEFYDIIPAKTALRAFVSDVEVSFNFNPDFMLFDNGVEYLSDVVKNGIVCEVDSYDKESISVWVKPANQTEDESHEEDTNTV